MLLLVEFERQFFFEKVMTCSSLMTHPLFNFFAAIREEDEKVLDTWARKENETMRNEELRQELNPRRCCLHRFFILFSFVTIGSALNMFLSQIGGIAYEGVGLIQYILRVYVMMFCALVVANELEWTKFTRESMLLNLWVSRGILYAFVGVLVLGLEQNNMPLHNQTASLSGRQAALRYIVVVAWMMVGCGICYCLMGISCLQMVCNKMRTNYRKRVERSKEMVRLAEKLDRV